MLTVHREMNLFTVKTNLTGFTLTDFTLTDAHIQSLNKTWRGKDEPTDVLSFPGDAPVRIVLALGDLVISLDTAARQAAERGHALRDECRVLLVHGVLHLLGFDHEVSVAEAVRMRDAEDAVLRSLGWNTENGEAMRGLVRLAGVAPGDGDGDENENENENEKESAAPRRVRARYESPRASQNAHVFFTVASWARVENPKEKK